VANALVCKTSIRGFNSRPVLHRINGLHGHPQSYNTIKHHFKINCSQIFLEDGHANHQKSYQQGSIRKVRRATGFAWEFRFYVNEGGTRKLRTQTFDGKLYRTESEVRKALEAQILQLNRGTDYGRSAGVTFGALLDRYISEEIPRRRSTAGSYQSLIRNHLRPRWGKYLLSDIRPSELHSWFQSLDLAPVSKGHVRSLMHKLFDLAALWEYLSLDRRNPIEIVKIKGVTKRRKQSIVLTPDQFRQVMRSLPPHVNMAGVVMGCLGLRSSEAFGLKWTDIDWTQRTIAIQRSAYRGAIDETKTVSSNDKLPLASALAELLLAWKSQSEFEWIFANPATGMPYMSPSLQQRWIRPAGEALGIKGLGFHSQRHSYRTWLDSVGTTVGTTKDLMRHSDIATTYNVYGGAMSHEKREANHKVVNLLLSNTKDEAAKTDEATS
jgi:integrase